MCQKWLGAILFGCLSIGASSAQAWNWKPKTEWRDSSGRTLLIGAALEDSLEVGSFEHLAQKDYLRQLTFLDLNFVAQPAAQWRFETFARIATEFTTAPAPMHPYEPILGIPYNPQDSLGDGSFGDLYRKTWDWFTFRGTWTGDWITLHGGLDHLKQGPAVRNSMMLGGDRNHFRPWNVGSSALPQSAPVLYLGWEWPFHRWTYTQHSGQLKQRKDLDKWFHTHRLNMAFGDWQKDDTLRHTGQRWDFGFTETVAYGTPDTTQRIEEPYSRAERPMQVLYTLPFVPYIFAQHYLGDRENTILNLDLQYKRWKGPHTLRFYGEMILDDLKEPQKLLDDSWWANKWGASAGVEWTLQGRLLRQTWNYEATRIEPWVGTHVKGRALSWTHYGQALGSDLGPNSLEHWSSWRLAHPTWGALQMEASYLAKGFDHGSDVEDIHLLSDRIDKTFLHTDSSRSAQSMGMSYEWGRGHWSGRLGGELWMGDYAGWRMRLGLRASL
jgi:hypothetical protein